ncbi:putative ABC transport system ATP-binding protein [Paenibacillus sophorae]|uniref:ABC transporter ATP-binding protein n=1 Tax=Paenibacillus sophorae TaxID=1333845 RepID=A0A1H8KCX6_9BACL|nr:ABC transporter ATP-binding protein [Paenibacillus sophorae]QWU13706.1 ABC transporter ATP-binding protein [Paenibacillus sophorae]SEN90862.1 putative ABC transport system ATP-binding protein [Paenibacillus sophorae]
MFRLKGVKARGVLSITDLTIPAKRITCIVGESGSGKTTLLRLLNQLDSPDEGEIWLGQHLSSEMDPTQWRRGAVMVPQATITFKGTIRDNLQIGLSFAGKPEASNEQLEEALHLASLEKDMEQNAEDLSGGEKQRLALARAIVMNPMALLLDEPTSALDEDTADTVMQRLTTFIRENGKTLVMITHSRYIADTYADFVIEMKNGVPQGNGRDVE